MSESDRWLIVGIGNEFRQDDGVGPWVAGMLQARGCDARVHAGDGAGLIDIFGERSRIILIDATRSGAPPGTLICLDAGKQDLPAELFHYSTHLFGLAEAVETARALGQLPESLLIWGIEGGSFGAGPGLTAPVAAAAVALVEKLATSLR